MTKHTQIIAGVAIALLATSSFATAQSVPNERYYMVIYGAQSVPLEFRYTHTWAIFIRTQISPNGEQPVEVETISWMPATLQIHVLHFRKEPGVNLSLPETLDWVKTFGGRVSFWGPYEIPAERYFHHMMRKAELESGEVSYRAIGSLTRLNPYVANCGQSFARASRVINRRYYEPAPIAGENGSSRLAKRYIKLDLIINPSDTHDWLLPLVGMDQYPMIRREPGEHIPNFHW